MNKPKIICIMPHGPSYQYAPGKLPEVYWNRPDGEVVGFWPREWLDYLGEAILKETSKYEWEVWQPDLRADRIYSKLLDTGVVHSLFPAESRPHRMGLFSQNGIFSDAMISRLNTIKKEPIIVMLYGTYGFRIPFYLYFLQNFSPQRDFPIFLRSGGMFKTPMGQFFELHRPLTYLSLIIEHQQLKKAFRRADVISEQSEAALNEVRRIFNGRIEKLTMGCDFDFWIPVSSIQTKLQVRDKFNIPENKTVFFASGNFVARKQFDKLIEVFKKLQNRDDFFLLIAGHGDEPNTKKLTSLISPLMNQNKAYLHPYVTGPALRDLYWASDYYVSVATDEGGPASVMKAMACSLPIISTPVGETADLLRKHFAGKLVPVMDYEQWLHNVQSILNGNVPASMDLHVANQAYHWPNVAKRFIKIYDRLLEQYSNR